VTARVLVAGIGNLFLGDDGFGPEVVRRLLAGGPPPPGVHVTDYGIRGMHLAYDLLDGWDALILVDALPAAPRADAESSGGDSSSGRPSDCESSSGGPSSGELTGDEASGGGSSGAESAAGPTAISEPSGGVPGGAPPGGAPPGEVIVVEIGPDDLEAGDFDAHGMQPVAVLGSLTAMGGKLPPTYIVGCPVESVHEGIGLSPAVAAAVPAAIDAVLALLERLPLTEPLAENGRP
jgi:hydrogenase maturation protease